MHLIKVKNKITSRFLNVECNLLYNLRERKIKCILNMNLEKVEIFKMWNDLLLWDFSLHLQIFFISYYVKT